MTGTTQQILALNAFTADAAVGLDADVQALVARRQASFGAASVLFYRQPLHMVCAQGAHIQAADGRRYLDLYNNVPSVGHCHPRVVAAVSAQMGRLNCHTRYLTDGVHDYAERLLATFPPTLSNVALTCTGSESNDLALRIAGIATGACGVIVTTTAYHGNTAAVTEVSPSSYKVGGPPDHVATVPPPDPAVYGADVAGGFTAAVEGAIATLAARGHRLSALLVDTIFSSDGVYADPPGFLKGAVAAVHAAGGLFIADEVQPGFGRTGAALWGFLRHGVEPDLVTLGKPMGNGIAMGGVVTRPELLARFCARFGYFNTFGGNPVAAAAGLAVLDVIAEEGLMDNAQAVGGQIRAGLAALRTRHPAIGAVRGAGLYLGIDIVQSQALHLPAPEMAADLINGLRDRQVLIGAAGPLGNVLKLRPPLCLTPAQADSFLERLDATLSDLA